MRARANELEEQVRCIVLSTLGDDFKYLLSPKKLGELIESRHTIRENMMMVKE